MTSFEDMSRELMNELHDALKHLMEEFHSAEELEHLIKKVSENKTPGIPETKVLARIVYNYRHIAHSEKEVAHDEDAIALILNNLSNLVSSGENIAGFLKELNVAAGHLKAIASYNDGELGRHLAAWQHSLNGNKEAEPSINLTELIEQEWEGFRSSAEQLISWIKTNAALLKRLEEWQKSLDHHLSKKEQK